MNGSFSTPGSDFPLDVHHASYETDEQKEMLKRSCSEMLYEYQLLFLDWFSDSAWTFCALFCP